MIGFLVSAICCLGATGFGYFVIRKWLTDFDPAAKFGLSGIIGIGLLGTLSLFLGLLPQGFKWGIAPMGLIILAGLYVLFSSKKAFQGARWPTGSDIFWAVAILFTFLFALVGVLTPSTANDWDSIAYHMAVPKLYALAGSIHPIVYIHHSNFPSAIELLFAWGILPFGQSFAKTILLCSSVFGTIALFGIVREKFGAKGAWIAAAAFMTVPTVAWESGTAYIDVIHGLYGGLAILILTGLLVQDKEKLPRAVIVGLLFGLACGTKYTGLLTTASGLLVFIVAAQFAKFKEWPKIVGIVAGIAFLVGASWYFKNIAWQGNPVYPFAYETFGGKNWDERRAQIYHDEQLAFGVGVSSKGKDWAQIGQSILGLAYQPGRYVNPAEAQGGGAPTGAIGIALFTGLLFWCLVKWPKIQEGALLGFCGLTFVTWFGLSQQSRYLTDLLPIGALLIGGAVIEKSIGKFVVALVGIQTLYTLAIQKFTVVDPGLKVALGQESSKAFLESDLPYYQAVEDINAQIGKPRVALYDQVFGYYLDVPYFWANPPHCTVIPYDTMKTDADYVRGLKEQGIQLIYVQFVDPTTDRAFATSLGMFGAPVPLPADLQSKWSGDWVQKWKPLLADSVKDGLVTPIKFYRFGALFQIQQSQ